MKEAMFLNPSPLLPTTGTQNIAGSRLAAPNLLILKKAAVGIEPTHKRQGDEYLSHDCHVVKPVEDFNFKYRAGR